MADFSVPVTFYQVVYFKKRTETVTEAKKEATTALKIPKTYHFEHLYFDKDDDLLKGKNLTEIQKLQLLLMENPAARVLLTSHSDDSEPAKFDLFFSIKRAEKLSNFLIQNGVAPGQVLLKGCGTKYPRTSKTNPSARRENRRIEFTFSNLAPHLTVQLPPMPADAAPEYDYFSTASSGLSYKVQIAAIPQMYSGDLIVQFPHATVESSAASKEYLYTVSWYKTFLSAEQLRKELQNAGVKNAAVVPYVNGFRVSEAEVQQLKSVYPDLENYSGFSAGKK
jgi:outer membrane protein OmpA-like peptidoglycan-associated protein